MKNPDFLLKNADFLLKNVDFLLKNADFIIKQVEVEHPDFPAGKHRVVGIPTKFSETYVLPIVIFHLNTMNFVLEMMGFALKR